MIDIRGVTKKFGRSTAVEDVSLRLDAGESVALWGANGAGKSTLIRCALGLLNFRGSICIAGHDVRRHGKSARMNVGYVPQELGFYDDLRVSDAVRYFARLKGLVLRRDDDVLGPVALSGHESKRIRELSGGMKQRLALAIALLGDPPVLVLDEVTASLDACGRREFMGLLSRLTGVGGSGRTMLFASHRLDEVTTLAQRVVSMERGRVVNDSLASRFVEASSLGTELHLIIREPGRAQAVDLLHSHGFDARLNGIGIRVSVASEHKAAPFRLLAEQRISIDDFELSTVPQQGAVPSSEGSAHDRH